MNTKEIIDKYLAGELPPALAEEVREWLLRDDPKDAGKEEALREAWDRSVKYRARPGRFAIELLEETRGRLFSGRLRRAGSSWRRPLARVAAVLLPLLTAGVVTRALLIERETPTAIMVVKNSSPAPRQVVLPDGSGVTLNVSSSLSYDGEREARLEGEAYFEVVKDDRPFVLTAGEVTITVLGTAFNVEAYPRGRVKVTLHEGRVEVTRGEERRVMSAGEVLTIDPRSGALLLGRVGEVADSSLRVSSFDEILARIAARHGVAVRNARQGSDDDAYTFAPDGGESLDSALRVLQLLGQGFAYSVRGDTLFIE
ncbi:MAG: FecR domain-containing protein [Odoribacteraceae bacterium]|jgi:ferric-dicitrate binding protein FerR (iron transport regulator)|nr:FecR domain-containing protein [Odoribacteraceae bacterium]